MKIPKNKRKTFKTKSLVKRGKGLSRRKPPIATRALTTAIKKVNMRLAETKHSGIDESDYTMASLSSQWFPSINLASWAGLANGTGDGQRIGNKINITKANLNYILRRNNTSSSLYPLEFHIWVGYLKQSRNENPDAYMNQFYEDGGSVLSFNGTQIRTLRKPNRTLFTIVKHMVHKCGPATTTGPSFINNDFPIMVKRTVSLKPLLGTLTYGDDGSSSNFNKDLWMWCGYAYLDDTIDNLATSPGLKPVDLLYYVDVEYKDF